MVALVEADAAPLSSYAGLLAALRSSLNTHLLELSQATRAGLQRSLAARIAALSDPIVVLAFYPAGYWGRARGRLASLTWVVREGAVARTLPDQRDAALWSGGW